MQTDSSTPNEQITSSVIRLMTGEPALSVTRMTTGDQNFVYAVKTPAAEYILRMTDINHKHKFHAAIAWQKMLLPLRIPLAEFIKSDLDAKYSPYPALLMMRLPGDDLINVYPHLTDIDKKNLASNVARVQRSVTRGFKQCFSFFVWLNNEVVDELCINKNGLGGVFLTQLNRVVLTPGSTSLHPGYVAVQKISGDHSVRGDDRFCAN